MNRKERDEMKIYEEMLERLDSSPSFSGLRTTKDSISLALRGMRKSGVEFTLDNFYEQIVSDFTNLPLWLITKVGEDMGLYNDYSPRSIASRVVGKAIKSGIVSKEEK